MRTLCQLTCLLFLSLPAAGARDAELEQLKRTFIQLTLGSDPSLKPVLLKLSALPVEAEVSDQSVIELFQQLPVSDADVQRLLNSFDLASGTWNDIDYNDTKRSGWQPKLHAERVLALAKYLRAQKNRRRKSPHVAAAIHTALGYWFRAKPVCSNWWYNQIGVPRTFGLAFLLFEEELTAAERQAAIELMGVAKLGMTGQNKVWLAGNVLLRALLEGNTTLAQTARDRIEEEIRLGENEGIQADWSFHQHGAQQQFGNYGLSFLWNMSFYARLFNETTLAFPRSKTELLTSLLLKGYRWICRNGSMDVNSLNRQLFHNADVHKALAVSLAATYLKPCASPAAQLDIQAFLDDEIFVGHTYFFRSEMAVHRTRDWMATVKMASRRIIGGELVNEDNLKGYYLADGALYVYRRGDEYRNVFPLWNWRRIPGTTTPDTNEPVPTTLAQDRNQTDLAGGATYGNVGITAMELLRDGVHARKSWVFTDSLIVCLGTGIHANERALQTTLDQRLLRGNIATGSGYCWHDSIGYVVLQTDSLVNASGLRTGRWHDFMGMYRPSVVTGQVFDLSVRHPADRRGSYAYAVLPCCDEQATRNFRRSRIERIAFSEELHAIFVSDRYFVAAFAPGTFRLKDGQTVHIDAPGTYIYNREGATLVARPFLPQAL